ncbi:reverse transcriptase/maturase family protein [Brasilonema sp. UFV-L1]|uniref:reverse transcriptase domain-containing protein n=1 Tax=Brasilonema sp. UFV-L1 TaxID=2234130 RepID=UPI00145CE210
MRSVPTLFSPLLANIALDGLEKLLSQFKKIKVYQQPNKRGTIVSRRIKLNKYGIVRYADDFIITAETKEDIEAIVPTLKQWLAQRGLELNTEKTKIVSVKEGFDFLGFNIGSYGGSCLAKPEKEKTLSLLKTISSLPQKLKRISKQ